MEKCDYQWYDTYEVKKVDRILLVEDDPTLIRMLTGYLTSEGFSVSSVNGQADAIRELETNPPELTLVDISLSEGNGFAVCACAKSTGVPVIFLTACDDEYSVVTGLDMGADDYISKPFFQNSVCFAADRGAYRLILLWRFAD